MYAAHAKYNKLLGFTTNTPTNRLAALIGRWSAAFVTFRTDFDGQHW
jgi:hypothetical protein